MKIEIEIDSANEACQTRSDLCDIIEDLLPRIRSSGFDTRHAIRDRNGNRVGHFQIRQDDSEELGDSQ